MLTAYLAAEGFEKELESEIAVLISQQGIPAKLKSRHGRLFLLEGEALDCAWAQNIWRDAQLIPFASINDGARKLKALGGRWSMHSHHFHRRASLIDEKIPRAKTKRWTFLEPVRDLRPPGSWTLLDHDLLLASSDCRSVLPDGEIEFIEDKRAPSRAYLKLWELFTCEGFRPQAGETCLDLGASPGGWTWVLAHLGCRVIAVDRSPLVSDLMSNPLVSFKKANAFTLKPEDIGQVDWLFSDVICAPEALHQLVETWLASAMARNFVCTIKLKGETDHRLTQLFRDIQGSQLRHLSHNKHELTWWLHRP